MPVTLVDAAPLRYLLSIPPEGEGPWPVLLFLHGYDEGSPTEIRTALTRHGPLRPGSSERAMSEFVIIAPQLPASGDHWLRYADAVHAIVSEVVAAYRCDAGRVYLTGFSFGGNAVFDLAIVKPEMWAALWPVDPTRVPRVDPLRPVWLSAGEMARNRRDSFINALRLQRGAKAPADRVWCDDGEDHVGCARTAYRDDSIYSWLLDRQL